MFKKYLLVTILIICGTMAHSQPYDTTAINTHIKRAEEIAEHSPDSAAPLLKQVLKECEDAKFTMGIGMLLNPLFNTYNSIGREDSTIVIFQQLLVTYHSSIASLKEINAPRIYNCLGILYQRKGLHEMAMQYYLKAARFAERYSNPNYTAVIYNNIASELAGLSRPNEALPYLEKAETVAIRSANYYILGMAYTNKGVCYRDMENWDKSELYFKKAIEVGHKYKVQDALYLALCDLGALYVTVGQPQKALPYLLETQSLQGSPYNETEALRNLGAAYGSLDNYKRSEYYLQKAISIADRHHLSKGSFMAHKYLAETYARSGNYKDAYVNVTSYISARDSVESQEVTQNLNQMEVRYRTSEKDKEIIRKQLQISRAESNIRQKNIWIISICSGVVILSIFVFFRYRNNQHKQRLQEQKIRTMQQEQEISQLVAVMKGEENERARLSRELHDGIGGMLASINMNLNVMKANHPEIAHIKKLDETIEMLQDTSVEVRKTAHNMMPDVLTRNSLRDVLLIYCESINSNNQLQINLACKNIEGLDKSIELILYRIIQELIQNVIKHAHATVMDIFLLLYDNELTIRVEDNGIGFDVDKHYNGYGLQNLKYRVQALRGSIAIMSEKGTKIFIEFDLDKLKNSNAA